MLDRRLPILCLLLVFSQVILGQDCRITLSGVVNDAGSQTPLTYVNVYITENGQGSTTNDSGFFQIPQLCPGEYHINFSHIGCQTEQLFLVLERDTFLLVQMEHSDNVFDEVIVMGQTATTTSQSIQTVNNRDIIDQGSQNLSNIIESLAGVSVLRNGNAIAKPVVHGLYGNRLAILNNGIPQSGQQWGNDHTPEIDPLVANKIRVLKGVSTLAFSGSNLGGLILVEPNAILHEPHVHGRASYFFESNGRSNGINLEMQQYTPALGWKINGTLKKSGDQKTANYFLNNTGRREANTAVQLEKVFADKLFTELYFSSFNTTLGILRGSHLGNLTDLEEALVRDEPLFTEDKFSYKLEAPKQEVHHQLLSLGSKYFFREHQWLELKMATQFNSRKEFDVRRSGRSEIPALSLKQLSYFADGKYHHRLRKDLVLNMGSQLNFIDNTNRIETGILPLIPDYLAVESGLFAWINNEGEKSFYEFGVRYDHIHQSVPTISRTTPREIERFTNSFHNLNLAAGGRFDLGGQISLSLNAGFVTRNPAINELYSRGLHQGVGGIEEGNPELLSEKSFKSTIGINGQQGKSFSFESLIYYHRINDFIYLRPSDETRLTIRGAFPVFGYEQTDATIFGFDLLSRLELSPRVDAKVAFSYLRGRDQTLGIPLIFMPPNNLLFNVTYHLVNPVKLGKNQLQNLEVSLESKITFRQGNLLNEQDFKPAPDGYHLMTLKSSTDLHLGKNRIRFFARADNIFNVAYRDYLNRQRYFADDLGFNAAVGATFHF